MSRTRPVIACGLTALASLALMAGCMHPCGYVDVRAAITPLGEGRVSTAALPHPLRITRDISERSAVLEVCVESLETTEGLVRRDTYGKATYVPWRWYAPILKLPVAATILPPFFLAFHDPHAHGAGNWTRWDYFRDVIAWFNLCSALPNGPRELRLDEQMIKSEQMTAVTFERPVPIVGRSVSLSLDGRELARGVSDAAGLVRFDLAPFLKPEMAQGSHTLRLVSLSETGAPAELTWALDGKIVQQFLESRPASPPPKTPPPAN